jgi:tripartite-type tricarboxylate transporter receptor subunit TctC
MKPSRSVVAVALLALAATGVAQTYPAKPVHIVVPFAAGGGLDVSTRQFGLKLSEVIRQPVVVENKVGAAGVLGAMSVRTAAPDGYTFLLGSISPLIQKHLNPSLGFDPVADFVPVANMASTPTVMVVRADHPAKSVQEVIELAKKNPGKMNYGSGGIGTAAHLAGASFLALAGLQAVHIPLKGSVEITASLLRGDTDFAFPVSSTAIPQVKSGKLRALATTSARPMKELPGVPTLVATFKNDLGVQEAWFGLWAPAKTPAAVVKAMHAAAAKALADPQLQQQLEVAGSPAAPSESPQAYAAFVKSEDAKWAKIVKLANAKSE